MRQRDLSPTTLRRTIMKTFRTLLAGSTMILLFKESALAGVLEPDCTPEKAARAPPRGLPLASETAASRARR